MSAASLKMKSCQLTGPQGQDGSMHSGLMEARDGISQLGCRHIYLGICSGRTEDIRTNLLMGQQVAVYSKYSLMNMGIC